MSKLQFSSVEKLFLNLYDLILSTYITDFRFGSFLYPRNRIPRNFRKYKFWLSKKDKENVFRIGTIKWFGVWIRDRLWLSVHQGRWYSVNGHRLWVSRTEFSLTSSASEPQFLLWNGDDNISPIGYSEDQMLLPSWKLLGQCLACSRFSPKLAGLEGTGVESG